MRDPAIHFDGISKHHYVKRFYIETTTSGRKFNFISEGRGSKLILCTTDSDPTIEFNYRTKRNDKKSPTEPDKESTW